MLLAMERLTEESVGMDTLDGAAVEAAPEPVKTPVTRRRHKPLRAVVTRRQADRYTGTTILSIIEWRGLRRQVVAAKMGYDDSALSLVLNGRRRITPTFVERAVAVFDLPPNILFLTAGEGVAAGGGRRTSGDDDQPSAAD
jgi:hypothetical protein